jgi:hypothetical protein
VAKSQLTALTHLELTASETDVEGDQQGRDQAPPHHLITCLLIAIVLARDQGAEIAPSTLRWGGQARPPQPHPTHSRWEHSCFAYVRARETPRGSLPGLAAPCLANWSASFTAFGGTVW